jgi:hypothetical protein
VTGPPPEIAGVWLHSHEEDTASTIVYRPRGYAFPPSRGRDALEFRPGGTLVEHGIGPDDRGEAVPGRWEVLRDGRILLTVPHGAGGSSARRVLSWTSEVLVLENPLTSR